MLLTSHSRGTALVGRPLNSGVSRQSIFLLQSCRARHALAPLRRRVALFRAGLRCCLSGAWQFPESCAPWRISHLRASPCARFVATWRLSPAVRLSRAGRKLRGIAAHSKQRYRAGQRRRSVLSANISCKRTAPPPLTSALCVKGHRPRRRESNTATLLDRHEDQLLEVRQQDACGCNCCVTH